MGSFEEIREAVDTAKSNGCKDILLFHCISSYPTPLEDSNLRNLLFLKDQFKVEIGLSDHTIGNVAAIASVSLRSVSDRETFYSY